MKDQRCQTNFKQQIIDVVECEYQCFYCDKVIISNEELTSHKHECHEQWLCESDLLLQCRKLPENFQEYQSNLSHQEKTNLYRCDYCGAECSDKSNLDKHITTYHELGTFYCDICPLNYPTNADLLFHKQRFHED